MASCPSCALSRAREQVLVRKRGDVFDVRARRAVRIAALLNEGRLERAGAVPWLPASAQALCRRWRRRGVGPGDTVRFGEVEWEWE